MELGTVKPLITNSPKRKKIRKVLSGGGTAGPGGGGNGGDFGDNGPFPPEADDISPPTPDKSRVITWFVLLIVTMTFGGLMGAYVVVATNGVSEWQPFDLPIAVWVSTVLLAISSFTMHTAKNAIDRKEHLKGRNWLLATTVLGGVFISSQLIAWYSLVLRGLYMRGNPYAGFFYILTAAHALHVIGGMIALGSIQLRAWYPSNVDTELQRRRDLARSVTWYWHFLGILWLALLVLLGFWK